jgi:hypothetical protein
MAADPVTERLPARAHKERKEFHRLYYAAMTRAPRPSRRFAFVEGFGDVLNGWADVAEGAWSWTPRSTYTAFLRDRAAIASDFWVAIARFEDEFDVHPNQQRLFDSDENGD